jgi:hypothetical protein
LDKFSGDNTDYSMNFLPVMEKQILMDGYRKIIHEIYSCNMYYKRVILFLKNYNRPRTWKTKVTFGRVLAVLKSAIYLGIVRKHRFYFWNLILWSIFNRPRLFPLAVTYCIYGYHFRKVFRVKC